jgi:glycosyltransferase involved in cell wall biosynthesis
LAKAISKIIQVNTSDTGGGAERIAWNLFTGLRSRNFRSEMAVGFKNSTDPDVHLIENDRHRSFAYQVAAGVSNYLKPLQGKVKGAARLRFGLLRLSERRRWSSKESGYDDFEYPGTIHFSGSNGEKADIIHCHNLHGDYFDLRALPYLSSESKVVITLHDAWLLSGHCVHSFDCDRWRQGCGNCPDLTIPVRSVFDKTSDNWELKRQIFAKSKYHVISPSRWLMDKAQDSILSEGAQSFTVIPNGVDHSLIRPVLKPDARRDLGIPLDSFVVIIAANSLRKNPFKDFETTAKALEIIGHQASEMRFLCLALGDSGESKQIGSVELRFIPFISSHEVLAKYYSAGDVFIHAAKVDTFPNTVLEAMSCGLPVIGTNVGGIPEQIKSLCIDPSCCGYPEYSIDSATGVLVPLGGAEEIARAVNILVRSSELIDRLSRNSYLEAINRYTLARQIDAYISLYQGI